jgi:predicted small secreted protein
MTRRVLTWCAVALALAGLTACNTVRGMGKDIEQAGQTVEKAAK